MKKKVFSLLLLACMVFSLLPAVFSAPLRAATASSVSDARDQIAEAQKKQQELQQQLNALEDKKENYLDQKSIIEQQVNELAQEIAVYDGLISGLDAEIAACEANIAEAEATYNKNIDSYKAQARATYERGETSYLDILLGSGTFSDFLLRLDYVKQVSLYEKDLLSTISQSIKTIEASKKVIEDNRSELDIARAAVQERKDEVDEKNARVTAIINSINSDEAALAAAQKKAAQQEAALNEWIEKELSGEHSSVDYQSGEWIWPVGRASYNYMSSPYGWRTLNGRREFHYAIDIAAPRGTPVLASKGGKVKSAKWVTTGGGWQVVIDHGGTYYTYYNHLNERPIVSAGQTVTQGQVIGYVGDSGYAFGTHLDFKIYYNGKVQNPINYVSNPY